MAYEDTYRLSVHAVILDERGNPLFVKTTYGAKTWTLPGGAIDPGETIHETLIRECREELGCEVTVRYLSGVYYHRAHNSQAFVFRCEVPADAKILLSAEHSEFRYIPVSELKDSHRRKIEDCLSYRGETVSAKF
jgi:8-oxo-dGTP pyrophosphatase MutT (NUDIX family)